MAWEYLKFFHLVFAFVLVSGIGLALYATQMAAHTSNPRGFDLFLSMARFDISENMASLSGCFTWALGRAQNFECAPQSPQQRVFEPYEFHSPIAAANG